MKFGPLLCLLALLMLPTYASLAKGDDQFDKAYFLKHLQTATYPIDPEASAVVLYENTYVHIAFENYVYAKKQIVHKIIRILKSDALDLANVHVYYPQKDYRNYVNNIKGSTYNMVDGQVKETAINKDDLLKKYDGGNEFSVNFSLPGVKTGCIIDYSYEVMCNYNDMQLTWYMQEKYPKLQSVFSVVYPLDIEFTSITHCNVPKKEYKLEEDAEKATDSFDYVLRNYADFRKSFWIRRNVEAIADEPYVLNRKNPVDRLDMQVTGLGSRYGKVHISNTWEKLNDEMWKGATGVRKALNSVSGYLTFAIDSMTMPGTTQEEKAKAVYRYIRDNYKSNKTSVSLGALNLKKVMETHEGSPIELNMVLAAMLLKAGIAAAPVIMSTTSSLSASSSMPVLDRMDYIAVLAVVDSSDIMLDASDKNLSYGSLPTYCYNGYAWVLGEPGFGIDLTPGLIKDKTVTSVKMYDFTDSTAKLDMVIKYGTVTSWAKRNNWEEDKDALKNELKELRMSMSSDLEITDTRIENQRNADTNVVAKVSCMMKFDKRAGGLYLNEYFVKPYEKNPFKATTRKLPVEFPYRIENAYYLSVVLPANMAPDSTYPPQIITFNDGAMTYKKTTSYYPEMHTLTLNSNLAINETAYGVVNYGLLRDFFQKVIEDCNKVLELKKSAKL